MSIGATQLTEQSYQCAQEKVKAVSDDLREISLKLHDNPETAWKEHTAHDTLASYLKNIKDVEIEEFDKYPTAFKATYSNGAGRTFALCSEYDALPQIGHGCGHNLIAVCGLGAFLAIKEAMDKGHVTGTVVLAGTPAEEGDVGKVRLMEAGACESNSCKPADLSRSDRRCHDASSRQRRRQCRPGSPQP